MIKLSCSFCIVAMHVLYASLIRLETTVLFYLPKKNTGYIVSVFPKYHIQPVERIFKNIFKSNINTLVVNTKVHKYKVKQQECENVFIWIKKKNNLVSINSLNYE